ncbi:Na+/H+ antiporter [Kitasatospora aureofaciens]|uniref:Na+/H+ antiporter n=2 Tax=Kitasatospora aureofaciens TaxID=1894 RepID=A0A8H9HZS8_KITAU|nr:Na+/H+ antiporter [Kitasatospora aureofaciens]QEV01530.1 Na+/H+ antiporter [Streptomyces viridifaciens]UKZ07937.1 Na+/H+ antiporter [Streptomyces viridifaciens]GGU98119.1 Na+/H+ antiporter [Kitasatospora aureofaciens]
MGQLPLFFLVLLASVVTMPLARRTGVPQPVLMTLLGIVMALVPQIPNVEIQPALILPLVLPPLIFAVARRSSVRYFKANARSILLLAVALVVVTTIAVAGTVHWLLPALPLAAAIALGALVSPPDPVAAVAVAGSIGLPRRLVAILESEGLFNDVTAIVIYSLSIEAMVSGDFSVGDAALRFVLSAVLAVVVGVGLGWVNARLAERLDDPTQQVALNLLVPFAAYTLAEEIHGSGVLAVVICALYLAERAADADAVSYRLVGNAFWEVVEILITGVAFGLIGLELATVLAEAGRGWTGFLGDAAVVIAVVVLVRLLWLLPAGWLSKKVRKGDDEDTPFSWKESVVLWWSGMRGVATVALALAIPLTLHSGADFPERGRLVFIAFSVVLFTLLVQGLTLPWLAKRLKLDIDQDRHEQAVRELWWRAAKAGLKRLGELEEQDRLPAELADRLRDRQHDRLARLCPEKYAEEEAAEARQRLAQWRAAAEVEQEMIAASRREMLAARSELGADPELVDQVLRGLDLRSERK